jgi:nitrogen fixation NifU-like protein
MDSSTKREVILEHYQNPVNRVQEDVEGYVKVNSNNESCIDNINLFIKFNDNVIEDIKFSGEACAISTASTSIMIQNLIGMDIDEALDYINNFTKMLNEEEYEAKDFKDAVVFDETYKQANRRTCVTLPYKGIIKAIEDYKK